MGCDDDDGSARRFRTGLGHWLVFVPGRFGVGARRERRLGGCPAEEGRVRRFAPTWNRAGASCRGGWATSLSIQSSRARGTLWPRRAECGRPRIREPRGHRFSTDTGRIRSAASPSILAITWWSGLAPARTIASAALGTVTGCTNRSTAASASPRSAWKHRSTLPKW